MQGSRRRSSSGSVEPELHDMLSSNPGDLFVLPRPPLEAAIPSWSFDLASSSSSSSSTQIGRFPRPWAAFFDEILPPSIDLQEGLHQQHAAGRPQNEQEGGGHLSEIEERVCCDGFSLGEPRTDSSLSYSLLQDLQLQPSRRLIDLELQDGASLNRNLGFLDEDSNTTPLTPPNSDDSCTTGLSKKPKLSRIAGSPVEIKPQISQSQVKKLGERITALQQLVSPFGKTDTASVLLEAIEYIKFLQDQVQVLSSPYMTPTVSQKISGKLPTKSQGAEVGTDLRSRGLCLVPISCTPDIANNNGADYWASGISGRSRC